MQAIHIIYFIINSNEESLMFRLNCKVYGFTPVK